MKPNQIGETHQEPLADTSRLCVHTITNKPWSIPVAARHYSEMGVAGITVWRESLGGMKPEEAAKVLSDNGLEIVSYCRGGFFPHENPEGLQKAIDENKRIIDEAAHLGAPLVVLVCGAWPGIPLEDQREQISDGIAAILPHAEDARIRLAIEPLHPMYAGDRSAINTLRQANDMAEQIDSRWLGVAVDVYHLWWDDRLELEIIRCGRQKKLFAYHVCDWKMPTTDMLNDRGLMGEGCIPLRQIRGWVEQAGFNGFIEVEIFSNRYWQMDQERYLKDIKKAYLKHV